MRLFTFQEHYKELRFRVLISLAFYILCVAIAFTFASELLDFLIKPLAKLLQHEYAEDIKHKLIFTSMAEGFFAEFKLCTHVAFLISIPLYCKFICSLGLDYMKAKNLLYFYMHVLSLC